jgi:HK97 family phage portal protein
MAYGNSSSGNIKSISLTNPQVWKDVLNWEIGGDASITEAQAYNTVGWVNRCVHLRASAVSAMPWSLMDGDTEIASSESDDTSGLDFLGMLEEFLYLAESSLCTVGVAYIGIVRNRRGNVLDLRWFQPDTITPVWSTSGLTAFERTINKSPKQTWTVENVIYFAQPNPFHETLPGVPPVATAMLDAQVIYNLNQYVAAYFHRGAIKPTILTVDGNPIQSEREKLKAWWKRAFSGIKNAFNTEVFSGSLTPVVVGDGIAELSNVELTTERREAISTALGVPHSMVMSNAANFATAEADRFNFYETTIIQKRTDSHAR